MIIQCESCARKFIVKDSNIPKQGRTVQCGYCSVTWHQMPTKVQAQSIKKDKAVKAIIQEDDSPSVDNIKASDGKTYKFLGSQWAELLPSGKTGLFAKRKIGQELDKLTGRKQKATTKKPRRPKKEVDPSEGIGANKKLPDIYKPKTGLGFFGYFFLLIVIAFSIVGILKTFENDLLIAFPQMDHIYELLDEQLKYVAETVKNMIIIVKDLINSY